MNDVGICSLRLSLNYEIKITVESFIDHRCNGLCLTKSNNTKMYSKNLPSCQTFDF